MTRRSLFSAIAGLLGAAKVAPQVAALSGSNVGSATDLDVSSLEKAPTAFRGKKVRVRPQTLIIPPFGFPLVPITRVSKCSPSSPTPSR